LDHAPVFRDWKLPPIFEQLRSELETRHGALAGSRQFVRVLQLLASHAVERIAAVIELTLARDGPQVDLILSRVERERSTPSLPVDHAWLDVPAVHVPRPDLSRFDQFLTRGVTCDVHCAPAALESKLETVAAADDARRV
jgi:hypothetical protein